MELFEKMPYVSGVGYTDRGFIERLTAELEDTLDGLFRTMAGSMPIRTLHWGHLDPVGLQIEKIARTDRAGTTFFFSRAQVGGDCVHLLQPLDEPYTFRFLTLDEAHEMRRYWSALGARRLMAVSGQDSSLLALLRHISDENIEAPFYQLRLGPREQPWGGLGFQASDTLNEAQQRALLEMEPTLRLTLLALLELWSLRTFQELQQPGRTRPTFFADEVEKNVIGAKGALRPVMDLTRKVAPLDVSVLISGESGTGKEVFARAVHDLSPRADKPFVALNCGAIPAGLLESELFGHARGAFTGAVGPRLGCFERADRGTLFLDEVGELPLDAQVKFLRILEDRIVERVGGGALIPVDVRVIAATNRNLEELVRAGKFRADLWYRIRAVRLELPPLRERPEDIPALTQHFLKQAAARFHLPPHAVAEGEMERLRAYSWPGNIRELRNVVEEALVRCQGGDVRFDMLPAVAGRENAERSGISAGAAPRAAERSVTLEEGIVARLRCALAASRGRIDGPGGAADALGLKPSTLRSKLDRYGLPYGRRWRG